MNLAQSIRRIQQQIGKYYKGNSLDGQLSLIKKLYSKNGLFITLTCDACPEQYEVLKDNRQVAYYRLRSGEFRVDVPECGGETIYSAAPKGDGQFEDNERLDYMAKAMRALLKHLTPTP